MKPLYCILYLAVLGVLCFPLGRLLARIPFRADRPPLRSAPFEQNGKLYEKLGIRFWQNRVPDVSKRFPGLVPRKEMKGKPASEKVERMIRETCVAEVTHLLLCIAGIALFRLWPGTGGAVLFVIYVLLGNLPFILIQRYNRPRLQRLLLAARQRERSRYEGLDSQQQ